MSLSAESSVPGYHPETDLVTPVECVYCHHDELESVTLIPASGFLLVRNRDVANRSILSRLVAKTHKIYGWRCLACGHLMLFTQVSLDQEKKKR